MGPNNGQVVTGTANVPGTTAEPGELLAAYLAHSGAASASIKSGGTGGTEICYLELGSGGGVGGGVLPGGIGYGAPLHATVSAGKLTLVLG